jgi:hypothetical protein
VSVAVFHVDPVTMLPAVTFFADDRFMDGLTEVNRLREAGMRHVSMSTELAASVGKPGVNDVLPEGYDWSKRHRGAGPERN